jgi:hypothetical protein
LNNGARWCSELPEQTIQIVEPQQVLQAAEENVSAIPTNEKNKIDLTSTATNADISQFLKLPLELRGHVYDYVFGSNLVRISPYLHVEQRTKRVGYKISMCTCEHDHTKLSTRVRSHDHETEPERICTKACPSCAASDGQSTSAHQGFSLPLLQVCRQIYHEAALKPFQQALFIFGFDKVHCDHTGYVVPAFVNALIPAQVKAVTRVQLLSANRIKLDSAKLPRLQGLKHLGIQLDFRFAEIDYILRRLESFAGDPDVRSLVMLDLTSVHVDIGLDGPNFRDRIFAELTGKVLTSPTQEDAKIIEEILKPTETGLLGSSSRESAS